MTKTMTAAAALLMGVALAATAQANTTMRQSATPTTQQTAQTGTTAAPQATKQRTTRKLSKGMTARRQLAAKRTAHKITTAKLTRHGKLQQTARLHHRSLRGQQQSTEIGSSTMPSTNPMLNTPPATNAPMAGSGSSMLPQDRNNTLLNQPLNQTQTPPIR